MSDMKCPFCQRELKDQWVGQNVAHEYFDCPKCKMNGSLKLWQELIRTRKALEIAVGALTEYTDEKRWDWERCYELHSSETAKKALEQITALEQKE